MRKPSMVGLAAALGAARLMRSAAAGGTLLNSYADDIDRLLRPVDLP
jgi:hypothetical protein